MRVKLLIYIDILYLFIIIIMIGSWVHAQKRGQGGRRCVALPSRTMSKKIKTPFPDVLLFGMNFMNFMNFRLKSNTYNVNAEKQNMNFMNFLI